MIFNRNENSFQTYTDRLMRDNWQSLGKDSEPPSVSELIKQMTRRSLIGRLRRRALCVAIIGLSGPLWMLEMNHLQPVSPLLFWFYIIFMLFFSAASFYWWYRVGEVSRYMSLPLVEAQKRMSDLDRLRRNIKISGWIAGAPLIALLLYEIALQSNEGGFIGALIGGIIGGAVGLMWEIKNRRQVKALRQSFEPDSMDKQDKPAHGYRPNGK